MKAQRHPQGGFWFISGGAVLLVAILAGCGGNNRSSNGVTAPAPSLQNVNDDIGEIIIPPRDGQNIPRIAAPIAGLTAANTVQLRWVPDAFYFVQIKRDGIELGVVAASSGEFLDSAAKPVGTYVYELCLCKGGQAGPVTALSVTITDHAGEQTEVSPDGGKVEDGSN